MSTPRVRSILLLALCLPVATVVVASLQRVVDLNERVSRSAEVVETADTVEELVRLRAALNGELRWGSVVDKLDEIGIPEGLVVLALGVDPGSEALRSAAEADRLVSQFGDDRFTAELEELRRSSAGPDAYSAVIDDLTGRIASELERASLSTNVVEIQLTGSLADQTAQWQMAQYDLLWGWMGVTAGFAGTADNPETLLVEALSRSDQFATAIERSLPAEGAARVAWDDAVSNGTIERLNGYYQARVAEVLRGETRSGLDLREITASMEEITTVTRLATRADADALSVVEAALSDLGAAAEEERQGALTSRNVTLAFMGVVLLALAAVVLIVSRMIIRPMAQVAEVAGAMKLGSLDARAELSGARETRVAAEALNEAVDQMKLAERQALALAEERLDDEVLEQSVPGLLGTSLQQAVSQLHLSLTERDDFRRRLEHEAAHDAVTHLPNRRATLEHLKRQLDSTRRTGGEVAVLYVDIDFFKEVNDRHGHAVGDEMLRHVATGLAAATRGGDVVGRIGGDEFLLIAAPVASASEGRRIAERVQDSVCQPLATNGLSLTPSVSIGVAVSDDTITTADELVRSADLALYRAKDVGRGGIQLCNDDLKQMLASRDEVALALEAAINDDELTLYFQPVVDAPTRRVVGAEALVRWERAGVGMVMPDAFIPVAERSDLIVRLDRWVLRSAARQLAEWAELDRMQDLEVAVNVSGRHLSNSSFVDDVLAPLREFDVEPARLTIEVTESAVVRDLDAAAERLHTLKEAGVHVALDDFGTGFASLAHLRSLPIDILKIDRSFIGDLEAASPHPFVSLVLDTGRLLGVRVVGEGVETVGQAAKLDELGCDLLQGFLFGRPQPPEAFEELIAGIPGSEEWTTSITR